MPSVIAQELLEIWKQLLRWVQQEFWHSVITINEFACNIQATTNLTEEEYNTLLLSSGILFKRGGVTMFIKAQLQYLQAALKGNIIFSIAHSQLQKKGKHAFVIAVGRPRYTNPSAQAKANPKQLPNRHGHGLDEDRTRLLEQLCADRRAAVEEPELIVEDDISMEGQHEQIEELEHQQLVHENQPLLRQEQLQRRQQFEQEQLDPEQRRQQHFQQQQLQELEEFEQRLRQDLQQERLHFEQQKQQWLQNRQQQRQPEVIQQQQQQQQQQQHDQEQEPKEQEGPEEEDEQESSENEEEVYLTLEEQQALKILEALDLPVRETSAKGYDPASMGATMILRRHEED